MTGSDRTVRHRTGSGRATVAFVVAGLVVAAGLAFGVSRWASPDPDGLERVAADHGLDRDEVPHPGAEGPLADYRTAGIDDPAMATGTAGLIGVAVTFGIASAVVAVARIRRPPDRRPPA